MPRDTRALAAQLSDEERVAWRDLQRMPNIGPAMAYDLLRLGIRRVEDLAGRDPDALYTELGRMDGVRHDPCVRDTFAAAVDYARTGESQPWWHFTPERKGGKRP
jgi:nucleotidyltransferase/DNA polymerase involved in DNA repair